MTIQVLIIDDQMLVRQGISSLLSLSEQVNVCGLAADGDELLSAVAQYSPDVVLLDIRMPKVNGIDALKMMKAHAIDTPVIILTTFDDHHLLIEGMQLGAKGYLLKDVSLEQLVDAIETVHQGGLLVQPAITENILKGLQSLPNTDYVMQPIEALTSKETEVLRLMAGGCSNKEISTVMHRSEGTIKNQVSSILAKLDVRDRTRAVLKAIELGLL